MVTSIDEMLERAIAAFNDGEMERAHSIAGEVLASDRDNLDAGDLLATNVQPEGELRRLAVMFCDLVGSTEMSERVEPETFRTIVARCQSASRAVIEQRYEGSIVSFKGDGILAAFGFPVAHENDADRAVRAGLDVLAAVEGLTGDVAREFGEKIALRVAVHKGVVFLDTDERDLYGFAVNVAARLEGLATPGTLLISDDIRRLLGERFDLEVHAPREVKGVANALVTYTVLGERMGPAPRARGPLVGRSAQLDAIREMWVRARRSEREPGECVTVVGDAGIGKSRLVAALVDEVEADGDVVVELVGSPLETTSGLWPVRRLIETRCGFSRDTDSVERLKRLRLDLTASGLPPDAAAPLATLLGIPVEAGYDKVESDARRLREQIEDAAFEYLGSCFAGSRGLLVFDDAHWFDDQTLALVKRSTQKMRSEVLSVVTSREASCVPRGTLVADVSLLPLDRDDALALLRALGSHGVSVDALHDIVARGDGVPLYLEELLRSSMQAETASGTESMVVSTDAAVPEVLYESLLSRLNLSQQGAAVAAAAAAIGREADRGLLAVVSQLDDRALDEAIASLTDGMILERVDSARDRYRFRHELLREVAYDLQPPTRRRVLHGRIADALVAGAPDRDAVEWRRVAIHYAAALRAGEASDAYERASDAARQRGALVESKELLSKAIEFLDDGTGDGDTPVFEREVGLRLQRGFLSVSMEGNSSPDAAADYERCLELSMNATSSDQMAATLVALWSYYSARAEYGRAAEVLNVLEGDGTSPVAESGLLDASYALLHFYRGEFKQAAARYDAGRRKIRESATVDYGRWWFIPIDPYPTAIFSPAIQSMLLGDSESVQPIVDAARAAAAELPFPRGPFTLAAGMGFEAWIWAEFEDFERVTSTLDEMEELSQRHGFDQWSIVAATARDVFAGLALASEPVSPEQQAGVATCASMIGNYMAMWKAIEQWSFVTYYTMAQGVLHAAAGQHEAALVCLEDAQQIAERTGQRFCLAEILRNMARLQPEPIERAAGFRQAIALAREQGATMFELRAALDLAGVDGDITELETVLAHFAPSWSFPTLEAARQLVNQS